ncbi:MAG: M48 family metallopeptidase [Phycisphaeraceae bacterium]|nr:M48 family metallopeptidase [Phycisphaeraceae bacterium]
MSDPKLPTGPPSYDAGAFDSDVGAGRVSGKLRIKGGLVVFESESTVIELPLRGLEITRGGANHRLTFFKHPDHPGKSVFTKDPAVAKDAELAHRPEVAEQLKKIRRGTTRRRAWILGALGAVVALVVGLWALKGLMVDVVVDQVPVEWEQQLGDTAFEEIKASGKLINDEKAVALLRQMSEPLVAAIDDARYPFRFHIARDPSINAFALPGGNIVVHTGLLSASERPEEVLGVLGHEIAHVTLRHGIRRVADTLGTRILIGVLLGGTDIPAGWIDAGTGLITLSYSREQESEADDVGWDYLVAAGIDPRGLQEFFDKLHHHNELAPPELLSTHPAPDNRSAILAERWQQIENKDRFRPVDPTPFLELKNLLGLRSSVPEPQGEPQP